MRLYWISKNLLIFLILFVFNQLTLMEQYRFLAERDMIPRNRMCGDTDQIYAVPLFRDFYLILRPVCSGHYFQTYMFVFPTFKTNKSFSGNNWSTPKHQPKDRLEKWLFISCDGVRTYVRIQTDRRVKPYFKLVLWLVLRRGSLYDSSLVFNTIMGTVGLVERIIDDPLFFVGKHNSGH